LESSQFTHRPFFFFSSYPAHPQFSTLSLHDALPIYTTSVGISPWKLAGSFMSFHTPRTPISTKNFWFPAHHFLTSGFPKSGNTELPGQTQLSYTLPSLSRTKYPFWIPVS